MQVIECPCECKEALTMLMFALCVSVCVVANMNVGTRVPGAQLH